ncbi:hypothetical protein DL764_006686 [Monosporascus ibericus]|uniref:Protein kinase domain-containing protein n=1 Tax=Monosporascus ibericus TaxID=155417 RepID=A0A4Q4T4F9_9PEZI|nr:hypothetical protein DL764_006686 [Monosporascus ibericus]
MGCSSRLARSSRRWTDGIFLQAVRLRRPIRVELHAYKEIAAAGLDPRLHICRLHGVVSDDNRFAMGILLTYIGHGGRPLSELHKAGVVWRDVKAERVLIDQNDNARITDFGGGYSQGWVDEQTTRAVEGDLAGMGKLGEFIFQDEAIRGFLSKTKNVSESGGSPPPAARGGAEAIGFVRMRMAGANTKKILKGKEMSGKRSRMSLFVPARSD